MSIADMPIYPIGKRTWPARGGKSLLEALDANRQRRSVQLPRRIRQASARYAPRMVLRAYTHTVCA